MKLSFQIAEPAGEAALLVQTTVVPEERAQVARQLLSLRELNAKSVVFLTPPAGRGVLRLETAGGEFSGNGLLQAAMAFAVSRGIRREKKFSLEIAGYDEPLTVHANPLTGQVTAELPPPHSVEKYPFGEKEVPLLQFPGTAYVILKGAALPSDETLRPNLAALAQGLDLPAAGAIAWDFRAGTISSALLLPGADALRRPQCCAASAAAVTAWQALHGREGHHKTALQQPGGTLPAAASVQRGGLRRLTVSSPVALGPFYTLEF